MVFEKSILFAAEQHFFLCFCSLFGYLRFFCSLRSGAMSAGDSNELLNSFAKPKKKPAAASEPSAGAESEGASVPSASAQPAVVEGSAAPAPAAAASAAPPPHERVPSHLDTKHNAPTASASTTDTGSVSSPLSSPEQQQTPTSAGPPAARASVHLAPAASASIVSPSSQLSTSSLDSDSGDTAPADSQRMRWWELGNEASAQWVSSLLTVHANELGQSLETDEVCGCVCALDSSVEKR
jgi:hypothetical protein